MITLKALNKYYNKNKNNELHVLKNVSITLPEKGMVVLLGPSGSGKSTLLNVLGGLDSTHSGTVDVLSKSFNKYRTKTWDHLRATEIGVIFQNYNLISQETVYENIAITLRMLGYKDESVIEKRVMDLLRAVKMERFYKRRAIQLSGGQQQRVAIARALAKRPQLLLTDEPTGNLDSKNTYDVMRILRKVADQTLVIMVTHEEALATQFADRILRLEDGKIINDEPNTPETSIHQTFDGDIYLGEFNHQSQAKGDEQLLNLYAEEKIKAPLDITMVLDQGTLYFKVDQPEIKKIVQVTDDSDIRFKKGKREGATVEATDDYDLSALDQFEKKADVKNVLDIKNTVKLTLKSLAQSSRGMKFLYFGFILTGALIALSLSFLNTIIIIPEETVKVYPENTLAIERSSLDGNSISFIEDAYETTGSGSLDIFIRPEAGYELESFPLYQTQRNVFMLGAFFPANLLEASDITAGRLPQTDGEVVIDALHGEDILADNTLQAYGLDAPEVLIGLTLYVSGTPLEIVGISNNVANGLFVGTKDYAVVRSTQLSGVRIYEGVTDEVTFTSGVVPSDDQSALINLINADLNPEAIPSTITLGNGTVFNVIGTYESDTINEPLIAAEGIHRILLSQASEGDVIHLTASDPVALENVLNSQSIPSEDALSLAVREQREFNMQNSIGLLIFTLIALGASALSFYFIIRSSLIERVRDIGIYRSLGIRSTDILKLFVVEALIISTLTSLIGFVGMSLILNQIQQTTRDIIEVLRVSTLSVAFGILFIYTVNLLAGLFPVFTLLRKTPAAILTKYDI